MDLKKLFTKRVNILFGFACLLPVMLFAASIPSTVFVFLESAGIVTKNPDTAFYIDFFLPQLIYPLMSFMLFFFALKVLKLKTQDAVSNNPVSPLIVIAAIPLFLILSMALTMLTDFLFSVLENIGIQLPTVEAAIPTPVNALQTVLFLFVMAVLPAICEEFIYRASFVSTLSVQSKGAAVFLSAIAFGLMHATVQQIPFAFMLGIVLALFYIYTGNFRVPVILHFANNLISCIMLILQYRLDDEKFNTVDNTISIVLLISGILALLYFIFNRKAIFNREKTPLSTGEGMKLACKAPFFWVFTVVYILLTAVNTIVYSLAF